MKLSKLFIATFFAFSLIFALNLSLAASYISDAELDASFSDISSSLQSIGIDIDFGSYCRSSGRSEMSWFEEHDGEMIEFRQAIRLSASSFDLSDMSTLMDTARHLSELTGSPIGFNETLAEARYKYITGGLNFGEHSVSYTNPRAVIDNHDTLELLPNDDTSEELLFDSTISTSSFNPVQLLFTRLISIHLTPTSNYLCNFRTLPNDDVFYSAHVGQDNQYHIQGAVRIGVQSGNVFHHMDTVNLNPPHVTTFGWRWFITPASGFFNIRGVGTPSYDMAVLYEIWGF